MSLASVGFLFWKLVITSVIRAVCLKKNVGIPIFVGSHHSVEGAHKSDLCLFANVGLDVVGSPDVVLFTFFWRERLIL